MRTTLAIPCYNAAVVLDKTLEAVLALSPAPDEILVVDDGSSDNSAEIVRSFSGIQLLSHDRNRGIAATRNTALHNSSEGVIVYIDADSIPRSSVIGVLTKHYVDDRVAGVGGQAIEVLQRTPFDRLRRQILFQGWGDNKRTVPFLFGLCSSFRTDVLRRVGEFDVEFAVSGEDMDMSYRLRRAGFSLVYEPTAMVDHMRTDNRDSLMSMAYRHCFWGFVAQRKNKCYDQKVPLMKSAALFLRQMLVDGIAKGDFPYLWGTVSLHRTIFQAWIESGRYFRRGSLSQKSHHDHRSWEGHGTISPDDASGRSAGLF